MSDVLSRVRVIDSHTAGEPTRVVVSGGPSLGTGSLTERLDRFRTDHDWFRRALVTEPRGSPVAVGALLQEPTRADCVAGVIFFNNVGYLGMCGHGTIGVVATLAHLGRWIDGPHQLETPVGTVATSRASSGEVTFRNVRSFRQRAGVTVDVPGHGSATGDVAWGGNWFFLIDKSPYPIGLDHIGALREYTRAVRRALERHEITGADGAEIDHIEVSGPPRDPHNQGRNFVLCPGTEYDRSPCGTGTSAKLACLAADGRWQPGEPWRQEGILGTIFVGRYEPSGDGVLPEITGSAFVTAEAELVLDPEDPFVHGIRYE